MILADLVGTWIGQGVGSYPTIDSFSFLEEIVISPVPHKQFLKYEQRTRHPDTGEPMHTEVGYLRPFDRGRVELVVAQPTGIVEVHDGRIEGSLLRLRSVTVAGAPSAKPITATERSFALDGDRLIVELSMAAVGVELTHHLRSELRRTGA